jgi:hypothetical protein
MAWNKLKSLFVETDTPKEAESAAMAELEKYRVADDPGSEVTLEAPAPVAAPGELGLQAR